MTQGLSEKEAKILDELTERYPKLEAVKTEILNAYELLRTCYEHDGKLLIAGNGGSCADSDRNIIP